jgi:hypothetical protein
MAHLLSNKNLSVKIDLPEENYNFSRFDWTGKITEVQYQNILVTTGECKNPENQNTLGKGFYNEFGIDSPLGFEETPIGGWFHKIGIGLLKKEDSLYQPGKKYEIKPADFDFFPAVNTLLIRCESAAQNGYAYVLEKTFELQENGFSIHYALHNTGEKEIRTDEYTHNFMAFDQEPIGIHYGLQFPFELQPEAFVETVNPEQKVILGSNNIQFSDTPKEPFFFSNLSGDALVPACWELNNPHSQISLREQGNFKTTKINLWGTKHVVSPELFFEIKLQPGSSVAWSREFTMNRIS